MSVLQVIEIIIEKLRILGHFLGLRQQVQLRAIIKLDLVGFVLQVVQRRLTQQLKDSRLRVNESLVFQSHFVGIEILFGGVDY